MAMTFEGFIRQVCLICKTTYLSQTITFEWCVIRSGFNNKHQKACVQKRLD